MRKRIMMAAIAAAVALLATPTMAMARPDAADFVEPGDNDVFVVVGSTLRNPTPETAPGETLYNVAGINLGFTWGDWTGATATARANQVGGNTSPRTDVRIDLAGLVPGGVYSIFYGTIGPDSENPKCPGVERTLPLNQTRPDDTAPDASSFIADASGAAEYRASIDGAPLEADQFFYSVVYHADGMTYGDLPNRGEFLTWDGGNGCRSSFGHDAMRQMIIAQKW